MKFNILKSNKSLIVCGFPGIGKSYLKTKYGESVSDSDSSTFPKEDFPHNYINHINNLIGKKSLILVSTHKEVLDELEKLNVNFIIVYPDRSLKEEYIQRYIDRGSPQPFIDLLSNNWDTFQDDIELPRNNAWKVKLGKGEFLSDYLN